MRRRRRITLRPAFAVIAAIVLVTTISAFTAANTVPASMLGESSQGITPNDLKPGACSGISVTAIRTGSGTFSGTGAAELVLGSGGADNISAQGGNDCVLGGGGNDTLRGNGGTDVCIGGPGTDSFPGSPSTCETQLP